MTTAHHTIGAVRPARELVVVARGQQQVPHWALRWCRRSGRDMRLRTETAQHVIGPHAPPRPDVVAGLAGELVLVVRPSPERAGAPRVVAAVRNLPDDGPVVATAAEWAAALDARLLLVHAVPRSFAERSVGLEAAVEHGRRTLAEAETMAARVAPDVAVDTGLMRVHPHEAVGECLEADLLVVGGPRLRVPAELGLVSRSALYHAPCPILFVPRVA
jgi:nucleotide-binding universal stress UspA family protein